MEITRRKLLAGVLLTLAALTSTCSSPGSPKENPGLPPAVTVKAGNVELITRHIDGYTVKSNIPFLTDGIAFFKGDVIISSQKDHTLTAYKISKGKAEIDKSLFTDGVLADKYKNDMRYPIAAGDGRLYYVSHVTHSTDGKDDKQSKVGASLRMAEGSTADKAYIYATSGTFQVGKLEGGLVTGLASTTLDIKKSGKNGNIPLGEYDKVIAKDNAIYMLGSSKAGEGDTCTMLVSMSTDGALIRRYSSDNRQDPNFMFMAEDMEITDKYVLVYERSDTSVFVFDKKSGSLLGKASSADMFGKPSDIISMAKMDDRTVALIHRPQDKDSDGMYEYALSTVSLK